MCFMSLGIRGLCTCHMTKLYCIIRGRVLKYLYILDCIIECYVVHVIRHLCKYLCTYAIL